jgi:hypothetical protein
VRGTHQLIILENLEANLASIRTKARKLSAKHIQCGILVLFVDEAHHGQRGKRRLQSSSQAGFVIFYTLLSVTPCDAYHPEKAVR